MVHLEDVRADKTAARAGETVTVYAKVCRDPAEYMTGARGQIVASATRGDIAWSGPTAYEFELLPFPMVTPCTPEVTFKFTMPPTGDITIQVSVFTYDYFGNLSTTPADTETVHIMNIQEGEIEVEEGETVVKEGEEYEEGEVVEIEPDETIVTVIVYDKNGKPFPNATVTIDGTSAKTGSEGIIKFIVPVNRRYRIYAEYGEDCRVGTEVYTSEAPLNVELRLPCEPRDILSELMGSWWFWAGVGILGLALILPKKSRAEELIEKVAELELVERLGKKAREVPSKVAEKVVR